MNEESYTYIIPPIKYAWKVTIIGNKDYSAWYINLPEKSAPCLFHRIMQRLILGFRWERIK